MDSFLNKAKEYLDDGNNNDNNNNRPQQQQQQQQGRDDYDQQAPLAGSNKPQGGLASFLGGLDFDTAKDAANQHSGSSGNNDMFSNILNAVGQKQGKLANEDIDEEDAVRKHQKTYNDDDDENSTTESSLGTAAAMQALKLFNKGETGGSQSAYLGLAMSEASKLFDNKSAQGKVSPSASKDNVVQKAAEMAMKMYFKSQGQQQGGLAGLASKFM
ncbi:hypothetical protein G7046_g6643 [Stylonectria norvegica]|nr:hypothetical protein G7046_g6643 [Stylonectria norvegica]